MQSRKFWRALRKSLTERSEFQKLFKKDADIAKDLTENALAAIFNVNNLLKNLDFIFNRVFGKRSNVKNKDSPIFPALEGREFLGRAFHLRQFSLQLPERDSQNPGGFAAVAAGGVHHKTHMRRIVFP